MHDALVSVIVPCYNQGRFLGEALTSIVRQTYPHWECLVINDGSKDDSGEVALGYAAGDARFRYMEQTNKGLSATRNRGLDEMRGAFVQFLDSDDVIHPDKLRLQIEAAATTTVGELSVVYADHYW